MKNTVHFGFISVILLMVLLSVFWLFKVKSSNDAVLDNIKEYDTKIKLAYLMRDATRSRQSNLLTMVVIDDPFELDAEINKFYAHAPVYRNARKVLFTMSMSNEERALHKLMDEQITIALPLSNQVVEMFANSEGKENILGVIDKVREAQAIFLATVDHFVELQTKYGEEAFASSRKQFDAVIVAVSLAGIIVIIIAFFISRYVENYVMKTNSQLRLVNEDMTNAYREAEAATESKSEFLATMSHEIRTPLTAIIGFAETTLFSDQTMEQRLGSINTIIRSGKHLLQLVNDILDLSKVEANKLEIEYSTVSPFELLAEIERMERPAAESKGLDFAFNYIFPLPSEVSIDQFRVKQILLNLCSNAIKFTDNGHVLVNVSSAENNQFFFEVIDSGIGISKEQKDYIFHAYHQADSSITRKFGGTGLGLSLSKVLAEHMEGRLSVKSELGRGSTFLFELPYKETKNTKKIFNINEISKFKTKATIDSGGVVYCGEVLLAEDNKDNQNLMSVLLKRMGLEVSIVENGKEAVEAIASKRFDVVFMDMRMPVMGGVEAVQLIRQQECHVPIIAVTANAMLEDKEVCLTAGCNDFLTKPIDAVMLQNTLRKYLKTKSTETKQLEVVVSSLLEHDPGMIRLVKRFVNGLPDTMKEIKSLIENEDWNELTEALHKLKGTSANFGFDLLSAIASRMEFQVINTNKNELLKLFISLTTHYQEILLGLDDD